MESPIKLNFEKTPEGFHKFTGLDRLAYYKGRPYEVDKITMVVRTPKGCDIRFKDDETIYETDAEFWPWYCSVMLAPTKDQGEGHT